MALVSLRQLLDHAAEHGYGLAAFNVNNMEQIQAIMEAAQRDATRPVIVQAAAGARKYSARPIPAPHDARPRSSCTRTSRSAAPGPRQQPGDVQAAIHNGFTSVMMDGSLKEDGKTPADYDYNVKVTAQVVEMAHAVGVSVEGELGCLGSLESGKGEEEDGHGAEGTLSHDQLLTDPEEAERFVAATGVDALAVAIGTSHGAYKFTRKPTGDILAMDRIEAIHARLPNTHLVMHGSSSVPQDLQDDHQRLRRRDQADLGRAGRGDPARHPHGVRKINVDTDIRLAMTGAMRRLLAQEPDEFDPRKFFAAALDAAKDLCRDRFEAFGSAGQASRIKPLPMERYAEVYAKAA